MILYNYKRVIENNQQKIMRLSFNRAENQFISSIHKSEVKKSEAEKKRELTEKTKAVMKDYLMRNPERFNPNDFSDIYPKEEIERHEKNLKSAEKGYENPTKGGILLENMATDLFKSWYGEDIKLSFTAKIDDMEGTDAVFEVKYLDENGKEKIARILIDFTTSEKPENTNDKLDNSSEKIKKGALSCIRYFASKFNNERGPLENVPRVIAGVSIDTLINLCVKIAKNNSEEKNHIAQLMLLDEMYSQLRQLQDISQKNNCSSVVRESLGDSIMAIEKLLEQKKYLRNSKYDWDAAKDGVFNRLNVSYKKNQ